MAVWWAWVCPSSPWSPGNCFGRWTSKVWTADPTAWTSHCCQLCARVVCRGRGGAAWQREGEEGGEEGIRRRGGRTVEEVEVEVEEEEEEMEEGEGAGGTAPIALPGARSEA